MKIYVDPPELHSAAGKLRQFSADYTTVYNRLINAANTMGDAYRSADNQAFVDQINGFCEELKAMADHLDLSAQALDKQAENYEVTRDNNAAVARQLAN